MTRLSRLTNILLHLQSRRVITAKALASKFGISQRTVYRDIRALEEAGVPIIGEAGSGYCLLDDYRVPPVMFTEHEINALLTAQQIIRKNPDNSLQEGIDSLVIKIKAILKYGSKEKSEKLEQRMLIFSDWSHGKTEYLASIQSAIINSYILNIRYHTLYSNKISDRAVEPLAIYLTRDNWLMIAFCQLRNDLREFRIDRILHLANTNKIFQDRHFSFDHYMRHSE